MSDCKHNWWIPADYDFNLMDCHACKKSLSEDEISDYVNDLEARIKDLEIINRNPLEEVEKAEARVEELEKEAKFLAKRALGLNKYNRQIEIEIGELRREIRD